MSATKLWTGYITGNVLPDPHAACPSLGLKMCVCFSFEILVSCVKPEAFSVIYTEVELQL